MNDIEQRGNRPKYIDELYKNSEPLTVQRYTGSSDCITYITTEKAIKICEEAMKAIQVEAKVMPNEVVAGGQFEKVLIDLVVSNYLLGVAEYNRNPSYNNEHFHHKAEVGFLDYVEEYDLELWGRIQNALNELEE